jgi:pimeloyl-ACP methyl ester carboxylesterase
MNRKKVVAIIITTLGVLMALSSFSFSLFLQTNWNSAEEKVSFVVDDITIRASFFPGTTNFGVMLFHGFGEDRTCLLSYALELQRYDFNVFSVDFSGHGRSSGFLPNYSNQSDNTLVTQVLAAKTTFMSLAGLSNDSIIMLGHSMGARAITRATMLDTNPVKGLILLGAALDIPANASSTDSEFDWLNDLGTNNPKSDILIITGTWDDVLTTTGAQRLFGKLANTTTTSLAAKTTTLEGFVREMIIYPALAHAYEVISPKAIIKTVSWTAEEFSLASLQIVGTPRVVSTIVFWCVGIVGLALSFIFGGIWYGNSSLDSNLITTKQQIRDEQLFGTENEDVQGKLSDQKITSIKKYFRFKLLLWLGAGLTGGVITLVFILLPISIPYFSFIFLAPIAGYGFFYILLGAIGKIPAIEGKWRIYPALVIKDFNWKRIVFASIVFGFTLATLILLYNNGWYYVYPPNIRLVWLFVFIVLGFTGFYQLNYENKLVKRFDSNTKKWLFLNNFLFILPFLLGTLFIGFSGTIIFLFDGIHALFIIALTLLFGELALKVIKRPLIVSLLQSVLLFILLLPRGPLMHVLT